MGRAARETMVSNLTVSTLRISCLSATTQLVSRSMRTALAT